MATATDPAGEQSVGATGHRRLWFLAVLFFVGGDVVTTRAGLATEAVAEVGPLAGPLIGAYGILALLALKLAVLAAAVAVWRVAPATYAPALPLGLAAGGALVTFWNTVVVLGTLV